MTIDVMYTFNPYIVKCPLSVPIVLDTSEFTGAPKRQGGEAEGANEALKIPSHRPATVGKKHLTFVYCRFPLRGGKSRPMGIDNQLFVCTYLESHETLDGKVHEAHFKIDMVIKIPFWDTGFSRYCFIKPPEAGVHKSNFKNLAEVTSLIKKNVSNDNSLRMHEEYDFKTGIVVCSDITRQYKYEMCISDLKALNTWLKETYQDVEITKTITSTPPNFFDLNTAQESDFLNWLLDNKIEYRLETMTQRVFQDPQAETLYLHDKIARMKPVEPSKPLKNFGWWSVRRWRGLPKTDSCNLALVNDIRPWNGS